MSQLSWEESPSQGRAAPLLRNIPSRASLAEQGLWAGPRGAGSGSKESKGSAHRASSEWPVGTEKEGLRKRRVHRGPPTMTKAAWSNSGRVECPPAGTISHFHAKSLPIALTALSGSFLGNEGWQHRVACEGAGRTDREPSEEQVTVWA